MKSLEDVSQLVGGDSHSAIADRSDDLIASIVDVDENLASFRRIFDRVLEQISEDLLETVAVAGDHRPTGGHVDMETTIADRRVMALHDIANERCPRNRFAANLQTSGFDARHIEQANNAARQASELIQHDLERSQHSTPFLIAAT